MPKIKTCKTAAKRFRKTGSGKFLRNKAFKSHILEKKSIKRKRKLTGTAVVDNSNAKALKKLLPYL
jgi:large subunit ribosomal protein L35